MIKGILYLLFLPYCLNLLTDKVKQEEIDKKADRNPTAMEVIQKIFVATDNIKTLRYTFVCKERVGGHLTSTVSMIKLKTSPKKLYLNCKDAEILWPEDTDNDNALVHPYGFPFINLNLDPDNSFLRKGQHHSVRHVGFDYLINIIKANVRDESSSRSFIYNGEEKVNDRLCYKITTLNADFGFVDYRVTKNETMISIARNLNVSEFMILENNPKYSSYTDVSENDLIKVPNAYSKMTVLYVDQQFFLPVLIRVYDHKGLYENFEYNSLQINSIIKDEELTKNFKEYGF